MTRLPIVRFCSFPAFEAGGVTRTAAAGTPGGQPDESLATPLENDHERDAPFSAKHGPIVSPRAGPSRAQATGL
jgi:hypothetical protein